MLTRLLTAITAILATAAPATAVPPFTPEHPAAYLPTDCLSVRPTFPVTGSHWKLHAAIRDWNNAQTTIRITTQLEPGCLVVPVHRYTGEGEACAAAGIQGVILEGHHWVTAAEIWLNRSCHVGTYYPAFSRSVIAHELGHIMGLEHNTSGRSVMGTERGIKRHRSVIAPVDVRNLTAIYR